MALGHEAAGDRRTSSATASPTLQRGDHVVLVFVPSCGHCESVRGRAALRCASLAPRPMARERLLSGARRLTPQWRSPSTITLAARCSPNTRRYRVAPSSRSIAELPLDEAALFGCAVLTGVGAVVNTAQVRAGASVADRSDLGGVGLAALLGATRGGRAPDRRRRSCPMPSSMLAAALGATHTFNAGGPRLPRADPASSPRGGVAYRVRACRIGPRARARLRHHAPWRDDRHRGLAASDGDVSAAAGEPRRRGAHRQGKLHRDLRSVAATFRATSICIAKASWP